MWVCANCEAENEHGGELCNVCDSPRSMPRIKAPALSPKVAAKSFAFSQALPVIGVIGIFLAVAVMAAIGRRDGNKALDQTQTQLEEKAYFAATGNLEKLRAYERDCRICALKAGAHDQIKQIERSNLDDAEKRSYREAIGNVIPLRTYLRECQVCAFRTEATSEIARLERDDLSQREEREYRAANGNPDALGRYVNSCRLCAYKSAAQRDITQLEEEKEGKAHTATFQIKSNLSTRVSISFYSALNTSRAWPGNGSNYVLNSSESRTYNLTCEPGEKICYGAWTDGGPLSPYWGAGRGGGQGCQRCCLTCPAQPSDTMILEQQDARVLPPSLTWHFKSTFYSRIELAFYSDDRRLKWPPGDQVYYVESGTSADIRLSCQIGQRICYGAWPSGNTDSFWGVGYTARQGCSNCCYTCNGGESDVISLNP